MHGDARIRQTIPPSTTNIETLTFVKILNTLNKSIKYF